MWRRHSFAYICQIFITLPTHFHMHIQRHTRTSKHVRSAHKKNGENQTQEPGWEKGFIRDLAQTHQKKTGKKKVRKKPMFTSLKKKFEHTELPAAKLRDNFITFSSWQCCCRLSKRLHGMLRRNLAKHCSTPLCDCWTVFLCMSVCSWIVTFLISRTCDVAPSSSLRPLLASFGRWWIWLIPSYSECF